jgi:hypothetical protein
MGRSEIRTRINRNLQHVFETYAQVDPWSWSDIRSVRWTHGEPWEVESRLSIEPANSLGVIVDQVVTHFEPYRRVDFISHFGGVTMVSQVVFSALDDDVTEVWSHLEFVGSFSRVAGLALGPAIEHGARRFYEFLKQECERESPSQISPSRSDAG